MVLNSGACICCKYVTSIQEYFISSHKPAFIGLNYRCRLHLRLKEVLYSQKYSHWIRVLLYCCLLLAASMGTTIEKLPVKDRLSQQLWQSQGCFTCGRAVLEYNAFDVLPKCVLLAIIKRLCWTLQVNVRIFRTRFKGWCKYFSPIIILVSLRKLAPSRNVVSTGTSVFDQNGMDFITEISFCKTPVVDEKDVATF